MQTMTKITKEEIVKMNKAQSRLQDIELGFNLRSFNRIHKNKKAYKRVNVKELIKNDY